MSRCEANTFEVAGQFQGFEPNEKGKLKYFHLATPTGDLRIKLAKSLRSTLGSQLTVGMAIVVRGTTKSKEQAPKLKAWSIQTPDTDSTQALPNPSLPASSASSPSQELGCIQVCRKSDCQKQGGSQVVKQLRLALAQHPQGDRIRLKLTGCMKQCKQGPNLVVLPDRSRYRRVKPQAVATLLEHHFPTSP